MLRSPLRFFGGKANMYSKILQFFPEHREYHEPFFGSGALFFAKTPCDHETINDMDSSVSNLFAIIRDRGDEFLQRCLLTEWGEELFWKCSDWRTEPDDLIRAWKYFTVCRQAYGPYVAEKDHLCHSHSRATTRSGVPSMLGSWLSRIEDLPQIVQRLRCTQISNIDWKRSMVRTDGPNCLHYLDPPYVAGTRSIGGYDHEFTDEQHRDMVAHLLTKTTGMVVLSGYANDLYVPLEDEGWQRLDFDVQCKNGHPRGNKDGSGRRTESLWLSPGIGYDAIRIAADPLERISRRC